MLKWNKVDPLKRISLSKRMIVPVKLREKSVEFSLPCTPDVRHFYSAPPSTPVAPQTPAPTQTPAHSSCFEREDSHDSSTYHNWDTDCGSYDPFDEDPISLENTKCSNANNTNNIEEIRESTEQNYERMGKTLENKDVLKENPKSSQTSSNKLSEAKSTKET